MSLMTQLTKSTKPTKSTKLRPMWTLVGGMQSRRRDRVSNDHRRAQAKLARALISRDEVLLTNIEALWPLVIRFSMHDKISQYGSMHPVIGASSSTPSPNETIRYSMSREFPLFGPYGVNTAKSLFHGVPDEPAPVVYSAEQAYSKRRCVPTMMNEDDVMSDDDGQMKKKQKKSNNNDNTDR